MNYKIKSNTHNYLSWVVLFLLSLFLSISYSFEQVAIESAVSLTDKISFPNGLNIFFYYANNSWSFTTQFIQILLNLNLEEISISKIILFISTFFYSTGVFLISKNISSSRLLAIFIVFFVMIFRKNFGNIDYPTLMFSEHTNGMISLSIVSMIFGLLCNKNFFLSTFFIGILISIHLTVGLWILLLFLISYIYYNYNEKFKLPKKIFIFGLGLGLFISLLSFYFFQNNVIQIPYEFNSNSYDNYMKNWDAHRNSYGSLAFLNYSYVFKSLILFLMLSVYQAILSNKENYHLKFLSIFLIFNIFISFILYVSYKKVPIIYPDIIIRTIPTRFFLMHSVIGYPIIISLFYLLLINLTQKFNIFPKTILIFFISLIIFYSVSHYKNIHSLSQNFLFNLNEQNRLNKNSFWGEVKKLKTTGYIVTSELACSSTITKANKPVIICPHPIDYIPYLPKLAGEIELVMKEIYEYSFSSPPPKSNKILDGLRDNTIKKIFEKKTSQDWIKIKNNFIVEGVIAPSNWILNLEPLIIKENYTFYKIP